MVHEILQEGGIYLQIQPLMFTNTAVRPIVPFGWPCLPVAMRPLHLLVSCFFLFSVTRVAKEGTNPQAQGL